MTDKTIALSAGHYPASPGACHGDFCEHGEAAAWVSILDNLLRGQMRVEIVPAVRLGQKVEWINARPQIALVCEVHFNSDESKSQSGSETLYCPGSSRGERVAGIVQAELAGVFPPSRGAKEGWYRMVRPPSPGATPDYLLAKTRPVALIVEPEFIYNWPLIETRRHAGCAVLARGLLAAFAEITGG
jgi:N-acetylmuramoyl-L-alanine amidase